MNLRTLVLTKAFSPFTVASNFPLEIECCVAIYYNDININRHHWLGDGQWMLRNLHDVTIVFGRNGSGKSQMLRAINQSADIRETHYASPERAGDFQYDQNIAQTELDKANRGNSRRDRNLAPSYRRESVSRIHALLTKLGYEAGRGQTTAPRHTFKAITKALDELLPEFKLNVLDTAPFFELFRVGDVNSSLNKVSNPTSELSSGETEALTLALDLLTICNIWEVEQQRQRILLIDEPDPHLHPDLQVRFAKFLISLVKDYDVQILVATHSTTLMAALGHYGDKLTGVLYLTNSTPEQRAVSFSREIKQIAAVLGGHALIGPLFGAPLLIVEGDDDYQIWSHVPRQSGYRNLFAVIPSDGESIRKYPELLEKLFGSLRDTDVQPAVFVLMDGDKSPPSHLELKHVVCLQLACHEAENLYLTNDVLHSMNLTWEDAQAKIVASANNYGDKCDRLLECTQWVRARVDLKGLIDAIAEILDPKHLRWTTRIGQTLGSREPRNELREFLGQDVVNSLWPSQYNFPRK